MKYAANFVPGGAAILTSAGKIDMARHRHLEPGESMIRLPALSARPLTNDDGAGWRIFVTDDDMLEALPAGTVLCFSATHNAEEFKDSLGDGLHVLAQANLGTIPIELASNDQVDLSAPTGRSLKTADGWRKLTMTKTGKSSWTIGGDLASG